MTTIAVLGLGLMGRPIARRLQAAGWSVMGWNRSALSPEQTADLPTSQTAEEAAQAEICLLMLASSEAVDAVLATIEPRLRAGQIVLDMGTSDPRHSRTHAQRLAQRGIGWVDAPVSGGPEGAADGSLAIMVGGADVDVTRVAPVLEALGGNVVHIGGPGAGHTAKIVNQLIVALSIEAVAEALVLAEASGLQPKLVQAALRGGFADSKVLQLHGSRMIQGTYVPGGKAVTQLKDLKLAVALAAEAGLHLPHLDSVTKRFERLVAQGDGELDHSALHKLL